MGLPWWLRGKESACQHRRRGFGYGRWGFGPRSGKVPRAVQPRSLRPGTRSCVRCGGRAAAGGAAPGRSLRASIAGAAAGASASGKARAAGGAAQPEVGLNEEESWVLGVGWAQGRTDGCPRTRSASVRLLLEVLSPGSLDQLRKILPRRRAQALEGCGRSRRRGRASVSRPRVCCPHTWAPGPRPRRLAPLAASAASPRLSLRTCPLPRPRSADCLRHWRACLCSPLGLCPPQPREPLVRPSLLICAVLLVLFPWSSLANTS